MIVSTRLDQPEEDHDPLQPPDGMRREWNFSLTFAHQAARVTLQLSPHWETTFIDPRDIEQLNRLDRDVKHCPMMPALGYDDLGVAQRRKDDLWSEKPKKVTILYSHIPPDMTLVAYCVRSVQHVLSSNHVIELDGCVDLLRLTIGKKLRCPHRLGGQRSFHFHYTTAVQSKVKSTVYAIGTIINQRGYLCTVECAGRDDLDWYVSKVFLPHYTSTDKFMIDQNVTYHEVSNVILKEQQELFGELCYSDTNAAVSFSLPMHPMRIRPDYSPTQTVGVGSIACMTLDLNIYQRPLERAEEDSVSGAIPYKINQAVLFLDVEDVVRMGYPRIMSTEQYSNMKISRLLDIFKDAKVVGTPGISYLGVRTGRSRTLTLTYEPFNAVAKVMMTSTIVCGLGVTAVFITKLGGGVFDAHLYLYQQLLKGINFLNSDIPKGSLSRFDTTSVRLVEQNLFRFYLSAPSDEQQVMETHLKFLRESCDARVESGVAVNVPVEEGGLATKPLGVKHHSTSSSTTMSAGPHFERVPSGVEDAEHASQGDRDSPALPSSSFAGDSYSSFHSQLGISVGGILIVEGAVEGEEGGDGGKTPCNVDTPVVSTLDVVEGPAENVPPSTVTVIVPTTSAAAAAAPAATAAGGASRDGTELASTALDGGHQPSDAVTVQSSMESPDRNPSPKSSLDVVDVSAVESHSTVRKQQPAEEDWEEQNRKIQELLSAEETDKRHGVSIYDAYVRSCEVQRCKPNSHLLKKLPTDPRFTNAIHELDLTSNYLGHSGFVALLNTIGNFPNVHTLHFNDMSLDNQDVEYLCDVLKDNKSVREVHLRNNNQITLPSSRSFTQLLRENKGIVALSLEGTGLTNTVIQRLQEQIEKNKVAERQDPAPAG
uniref:Uncharacterized protein n=1 Tax=Trypanosoma congolense (strain IL3000) TaxID=1068625 RepID=G0URA6_TRYCI|nr:conserved hypothetical protein [Trypanosoma congolense IL3000]